MGIFFGSKKKDELVLVLNIGSSAVGGALFRTEESGIPKIIFSVEEPILVEKKVDVARFLSLTIKSLEIVVERIYKAGRGAPSKIFCVLDSPWHVSQTRIINFKKNTPFTFNTKLADSLIQKEIALFEKESLVKGMNLKDSVRVIELKNIRIMLNGYETSKPLDQKTQELEMAVFISISGEEVLKKIENTVARHFHFKEIRFHSFLLSSFTVVRDLYLQQDNFLLINIGGEITDISMVKKNVLRESISFPLGQNFLTRGVASSLDCTLGEANSLISLFQNGHAEESVTEKLVSIINQLKTKWLEEFQKSLANLSKDISIPATVYISIDKDLADFFKDAIKNEQFNQYILTESKFEVIFLNTQILHGIASFEESVIRDPILVIDAVFINHFLIYPPSPVKAEQEKKENEHNTMSKHFLEDMTRVSHPKQEMKVKKVEEAEETEINYSKKRPRYMLWLVALISIVFFVFSLSFLFAKAEIKINPKIKEVVLNENLSASKDSNTEELSFDLVAIGGEESVVVKTSEEKEVLKKAIGTVIIYNAFGSTSQALDIDTRLEGSNGKIYKTQTKTVVPGRLKDNTPGSVEVKIYGAEAGADYNSVPLDFKIFGFKGTPKYSKFYARSKGEITGGFKGKASVLSDSDKINTEKNLKVALQAKLLKKAIDQTPNGFILFRTAFFLDTEDLDIPLMATDKNLTVKLQGTLFGILLNEQKLTKKIAESKIEKYDGSEVYLFNIRDLVFSLSAPTSLSSDVKNINFNLSGPTKIVWKLDVDKFTASLLGKSKNEFNQLLAQYPSIDSATLSFSPFWKMSIPNDSKNIKVIVNYPAN